jgi:hypothetical protein
VSALRRCNALWEILRQRFYATYPGRWIGRGGLITWPLRWPDLTPMKLFLWTDLKEYVYAVCLRTIKDLVARLQAAVTTVDTNKLGRVRENSVRSTVVCLEVDRGRSKQIL